jgi:hypothetical protein
VFAHEWGIYNLASLLMGSGKRQGPGGEIVDDGIRREKRRKTGMTIVVDGNVKCMDCRIGESDGIGGFYCPEKNQEIHGKDAETPRKCNYFQPREDDLEIADASEQEEYYLQQVDQGAKKMPEEPKRKKTMADIAAMGREALRKKREEMRKGIQEKVVEKRTKAGGNGKVAPVTKPPMELTGPKPAPSELNVTITPSPIEQRFNELKKPKKEQLQDMLGSFTVRELMQAGGVQLLLQVGAMMDTLEGKGRAA